MTGRATLDRYFDAMRGHEWTDLAACLSENVERIGPYLDRVEGRENYAAFLARVVPSLENYQLTVNHVHEIDDLAVFVELTETLDVDGVSTDFPEALYFGFDDAGLIEKVSVYIKQPPS